MVRLEAFNDRDELVTGYMVPEEHAQYAAQVEVDRKEVSYVFLGSTHSVQSAGSM